MPQATPHHPGKPTERAAKPRLSPSFGSPGNRPSKDSDGPVSGGYNHRASSDSGRPTTGPSWYGQLLNRLSRRYPDYPGNLSARLAVVDVHASLIRLRNHGVPLEAVRAWVWYTHGILMATRTMAEFLDPEALPNRVRLPGSNLAGAILAEAADEITGGFLAGLWTDSFTENRKTAISEGSRDSEDFQMSEWKSGAKGRLDLSGVDDVEFARRLEERFKELKSRRRSLEDFVAVHAATIQRMIDQKPQLKAQILEEAVRLIGAMASAENGGEGQPVAISVATLETYLRKAAKRNGNRVRRVKNSASVEADGVAGATEAVGASIAQKSPI